MTSRTYKTAEILEKGEDETLKLYQHRQKI